MEVQPEASGSSVLPSIPTDPTLMASDEDLDFDPAILANLAALSRIEQEDSNGHLDPALQDVSDELASGSLLAEADARAEGEGSGESSKRKRQTSPRHSSDEESYDDGREVGDSDDGDFQDPRYVFEDGRLKRKRNRTTLSCTECHRRKQQCDRNIPCNRCVRRGVPSMCRMEAPLLPEKKKKSRPPTDVPIDQELSLRVQALESLIKSGSSLDPDSASAAALETILQATRAANSGSQDASTALAQLSESALAGGGIGGMSQDAQNSLLMEVLQQLSVANQARTKEDEGDENDEEDIWSSVGPARPDAFTRVSAAFASDPSSSKMNLSLPGFRDDSGNIFIPPTVRYVEKQMRKSDFVAREALPIWGDDAFLEEGIKFAYGSDHVRFQKSNIAAVQASTLTGAIRLAGTFLARFPAPAGRTIYLPSPATEEDTVALRDAGLDIKHYRFLDRKTNAVDFQGLKQDILAAPSHSAVLLYMGGTLPTGLDLSESQWRMVTSILQDKNLIPLIIFPSQGLMSGDPAKDAQSLRHMAHEGLPLVFCQSFDPMMGLHTESPAIVSIVTQSSKAVRRVGSQLRAVARGLQSHPSPWGARIVHSILSDQKLYTAWLAEIKAMSDRLRSVRDKLFDLLANKFETPGQWGHLKKSSGMYCSTLLTPSTNESLASKRHVHLLPFGSFSLGCLNAPKIEALARAIDSAVLTSIHEAEEAQAQQIAMEIALAAAKEEAAREEAEAAAAAAREEDRMLMESSIASAIEAQRRAEEEEYDREEDERRREEEERGLDEAVRKAAERAEVARQAEAILASIQAGVF